MSEPMIVRYPILQGQTEEAYKAERAGIPYPRSVSWSLVQGHAAQAYWNHGQTLERLAERGGLCPLELWCVVHDKKWKEKGAMTSALALEWLRGIDDVEWKVR